MVGGSKRLLIDGSYGGANNNKVLNNTILSSNGVAHAVLINSADNTQFNYNIINVPRVGD